MPVYTRLLTPPGKTFLLLGPRGTGKTTWLKASLKPKLFINLLHSEEYLRYRANPELLREAFTNDEEKAVNLDRVVPFFLADQLVERGARHRGAPNFEPQVIVSERLVTGQNPASATGVAQEMVKLLSQTHQR